MLGACKEGNRANLSFGEEDLRANLSFGDKDLCANLSFVEEDYMQIYLLERKFMSKYIL